MSTKTPKSVILRTVPRMIVPTLISSNLMIFWRVSGAGKSSRGSRPGFVIASKISLTVKTPAFNLVANLSISTNLILALSKSNLFLSAKSSRENPNSANICSARGYDSGCTGVLSSGQVAPLMRKNPAH